MSKLESKLAASSVGDGIIERLKSSHESLEPQSLWRKWRLSLGIVVLATGLGVAIFTPINMNVTAPGKVVPSSRVKTVQHLEGGIVTEVFVKEGDAVEIDEPLMQLDLGAASLNLEELTVRKAGMNAARIRLRAEASRSPLTAAQFSEDINDEIRKTELLTYRARNLELEGQLAAANAQVQMQTAKISEVRAQIIGLTTRQEISDQQHALTSQLAKEKLVPQIEAIQSRKDVESNRMELTKTRQSLQGVIAAKAEAEGKLAEVEGRFRRRAAEELLTTERQFSTVTEDFQRAQTQRLRNVIKAPIAGIIKGLRSSESGWVIRAGEPILEVVPANAQIEIEARLAPSDRGLVQVGQQVKVKVSAYDFLKYGSLGGAVQMIAADADKDPNGSSYFKMVIRTNSSVLSNTNSPVTPGMTADVDVIVGTQTFAWFLLRPVLKIGSEAFREP
ncbi:MAG: adhesin transport system membrane fusion protein [Rhodoferax sp.]|jgi:adhesin transport system membrane fusion protein